MRTHLARCATLVILSFAGAACADSVPTTAPPAPLADISPAICGARANSTIDKLTSCVTSAAVSAHQAAFDGIATANGGARAAGTSGYDASAAYVAGALGGAGYAVTLQSFTFDDWVLVQSSLEQVSPFSTVYVRDTDYEAFGESAAGDVTAAVTAVDLELGLLNSSTSGCEAADFAGFPAGQIALLQRGACEFSLKAQNAEAAGAVGVIIFNQGNTLERMGLPSGTLGEDHGVTIPVVGATYDRGVEWATTLGVIMRIQLQVATGPFTAANVIAELKGSRPGNVVIAGARLDSDINTPGLNNNGSGAAALLETAVQIARVRPQNTVRFIWWAAGFNGQAGASHYLSQLSAADLNAIALYLDANAIASPNYVFFVYDGDGSLGGASGPAGSAAVESVLRGLYSAAGVPYEQLEYASEHSEFAHAGIPVGGITTGTTGIKSPEEQALYGGTAGEQYDPCYGLPCDTFANFSTQALDMNSDIVASAVLRFGMSTEGVNGVRGRGVYRPAAATSSLSLQ